MKKVVIGISGGVDSSVAALLLKQKGYEVIGVTFIFTDNFDVSDAKEVCKKLNIEHHIIDYTQDFKEKIINQFISDYKNGLTPNPCVLCNKILKIKYLFDAMKEFNCNYVATGHYATIKDGKLYKSKNINKDQSYFLAQLSKEQLECLLFPLEDYEKDEIRKIANENNLINANKKDSFDVCFITTNFKDYISSVIKPIQGNVINIETNEIIGKHNGLMNYTIGQRRGLDIGGNAERLFVVGKNTKDNILYVALGDSNEYLYSDSCIVDNLNFNSDIKPTKCSAKFRYKSIEQPVEIEYLDNDEIVVKYEKTKSVTPGQACVFYLEDNCIGGGTIKEVKKNNEKLWYLL